jgi:hypothetical protein
LGEQQCVIRLCQVSGFQDALQLAIPVRQGDERGLLLGPEPVDPSVHLDPCAFRRTLPKLDILVAKLNLNGGGQRRVLLHDDALCLLQRQLALLPLFLLRDALLLGLFLVPGQGALGFFYCALRGLFPDLLSCRVWAVRWRTSEILFCWDIDVLDVGID